MITFNIAQWRAWGPGLESADDWHAWCRNPVLLPASEAAPDVSFLPAMQRRRLSRLARMAFSVGWPLAEGLQDLPLVFVSRHGETPRTLDILSDLANEQPLSPTQFSALLKDSPESQMTASDGYQLPGEDLGAVAPAKQEALKRFTVDLTEQARGQTFSSDFGHVEMLVSPAAQQEVWPLVRDWLAQDETR